MSKMRASGATITAATINADPDPDPVDNVAPARTLAKGMNLPQIIERVRQHQRARQTHPGKRAKR